MERASSQSDNAPRESMSSAQHLEMWKYFASVGGADKDRMVTIATWLLAFSAAIIGYTATHWESFHGFARRADVLAALGFLVSLAAGWIVLLYGAYANWNWARADRIAEEHEHEWVSLQRPETFPSLKGQVPKGLGRLELWTVKKLGKPHPPGTRLAPVFRGFYALAALSLLIHAAVFVL